MKTIVALLVALSVASCACAGEYRAVSLADDRSSLRITTSREEIEAPRTVHDQEGFSHARISPDGNLVGWLALTSNCCTSYPLPTALVIFKHGKVIRTVTEQQAIFAWSFAQHGAAVAYQQTFPHGLVPYYYKLRRISDGKLVEEFECFPKEGAPGTSPGYQNSGPVPDWVWPLAVNAACPAR